jgi:hypothetical protein
MRGRSRRRPTARSVSDDSVGQLAELYLGNILYALELAAMSLDEQKKPTDAAFYRGIGRKLAEAHGRAKERASPPGGSGQ